MDKRWHSRLNAFDKRTLGVCGITDQQIQELLYVTTGACGVSYEGLYAKSSNGYKLSIAKDIIAFILKENGVRHATIGRVLGEKALANTMTRNKRCAHRMIDDKSKIIGFDYSRGYYVPQLRELIKLIKKTWKLQLEISQG